ncbi:uncharacterized protein LOC120357484 [Solenopsis invicta]|uniref:uncharacterized protein LOC120357484 n=1 Tax=Solenopsis invicta TaxID=13686 RepID=UPI000595D68E|nr:uncharacterized protein LOC120357484 [Solenopsis invicta]
MHKWNLNKNLISNEDNKEISESVNFNKEVNTLGIIWNPKRDTFQYRINLKPHLSKLTKRVILPVASKIFDPLGSIGPITVQSKLLLQNLWRSKVGWDNPVPAELQSKWTHFRAQLQSISKISIPRYAFSNDYVSSELHGFCDASELAYGCYYIKTENSQGDATVNLLCAKSRVAPVKSISLSRLELLAALLLARLYQQVTKALTIKPTSTHLWSDSTITLAWIKGESSRWVPFVANRVTEIQKLTDQIEWHHVDSKGNPADIISRGMNPEQLNSCLLWWNGPKWLKTKD